MATKKRKRTVRERPSAMKGVDYQELLKDIKSRIQTAQVKASLSVNRELIQLYWDIGGSIVKRQETDGWGKSVVERLAADVQKSFPGIEGFSPQNIWKMRGFFLAWTQGVQNLSRAVRGKRSGKFLSQAVREIDGVHMPQPVAEIPWGHNTELIFKLSDPVERLWYAYQTTAKGWSRAMLVHWIESDLYARQGNAVTNLVRRCHPRRQIWPMRSCTTPIILIS
jgi:predicted nuclease of restriction endonuclease-like (RecB) superfamily